METSFEALPAREGSKRLRKRTRPEPAAASASSAAGGGAGAGGGQRDEDGVGRVIHDTSLASNLQYEFLDHTADVQLHSWGESLAEAFAHCALAQWGYMTDPASIRIDPSCDRVIEASGRDPITLLYTFLDRCLYEFTGDDFLASQLQVLDFICPEVPRSLPETLSGPDADDSHRPEACYIRVSARGERFVFGRHPQGTEVKAVTFSNMQIVVDVSDVGTSAASAAAAAGPYSGVSEVERDGARLRQYTANDSELVLTAAASAGAEGSGVAAGGAGVALASAQDAAVAGSASGGIPGLQAPEVTGGCPPC